MENIKLDDLTPQEIVEKLDAYIIGQDDAKKSVAIALRNRYRRKRVEDEALREEIAPKNILCVGPTGVGKTEIARRLAKLANAPFLKIEATKFTEVGYVGRDVESIIRDLVELAVKLCKNKVKKEIAEKALSEAKIRVVMVLVGETASEETIKTFLTKIESGSLDDSEIEIEVEDAPSPMSSGIDIPGMAVGMINVGDMLGKAMGMGKTKKRKMTVKEAIEVLKDEESEKMLDEDKLIKDAIRITENDGIVFLDEIDKICERTTSMSGREVSREGVQRDLLPLIEGTTVTTKYGLVNTDHILFIASGAFHSAKPSDLLPELQGRFPIRVKLNPLTEEDLVRILKEPKASLVEQYIALLATEGVNLKFAADGIKEIARVATRMNEEIENTGARRLYGLMEKVLEDISFNAPNMKGKTITINAKYVKDNIGDEDNADLSKFIL